MLIPGGQVRLGEFGVTSQLEDGFANAGSRLRFPYGD
jgi:hypothetical protein